ncbi:class I SAM-dependent methyltransferase [Tautonia sp. JC769]|uniref:O-methyltransferase n=1 Tax=Tautonia sp. JC769 TaxID=3232135 RepID=UPI003457445E
MESFVRRVRFRVTRKLKSKDPLDVWPAIPNTRLVLRPFANRFGNVKLDELITISAIAQSIQAQKIFEFGTFDGLTTWHLAANCGPTARVWTLDLPLDHPARKASGHDRKVGKISGVVVGQFFLGTAEQQQVDQLFGDSLQFDPSPYRHQLDLCFIDAGHGYEHVRRDTDSALEMTRPGGVIIWHDYSRWWPGVQKVLDDLSTRLPVFRIAGTSLGVLVVGHD